MEAQKKRISPYIYLIIIVLSYLTAGFCQYRLQPILTYMMQGMQIDEGKAGVLVSHDLCQALRTADRVALLADGRLCMAGTPEQVYAGGALDRVFGVRVRRVPVDGGWQYFCE